MTIIKCCGNCKHWSKYTDYSEIPNSGICSEIQTKVGAEVTYDLYGGGYINHYESEEDFYCSLHISNKIN